jgi:hypothetical protein
MDPTKGPSNSPMISDSVIPTKNVLTSTPSLSRTGVPMESHSTVPTTFVCLWMFYLLIQGIFPIQVPSPNIRVTSRNILRPLTAAHPSTCLDHNII